MSDIPKKFLTKKEFQNGKPGYVYAPYTPIMTKTILYDENGTHVTWQIGRWMRFKLWVLKKIGLLKDIEKKDIKPL